MKKNWYKPTKKSTLFGWLEQWLKLHYPSSISTYHLYHFLYLFFLGLLYVWNVHYHEKMLYEFTKLQPRVEDLRVKYMRLQSCCMLDGKQSTIANQVARLGIYESKVPPYRIKANQKR